MHVNSSIEDKASSNHNDSFKSYCSSFYHYSRSDLNDIAEPKWLLMCIFTTEVRDTVMTLVSIFTLLTNYLKTTGLTTEIPERHVVNSPRMMELISIQHEGRPMVSLSPAITLKAL